MVFYKKLPELSRTVIKIKRKYRSFEDRYEILELISESFKTRIFKAYDRGLRKFVAIKIIRFDAPAVILGISEFIKRWDRMCKYTQRLKHPNILRLLDNGINRRKNFVYYTTAFISGFSLDDTVRMKKLDFKTKLQIASELVNALAYAHRKGVIHRDIKPSNILVDNYGKPYLTDFQSARFEANPITQPGLTFGTPIYMSPEQIKGDDFDERSDIFSLGNVFYYLFYGKIAFAGKSFIEISNKIVNDEPEQLSGMDEMVPEELASLVTRMLKKDPDARINNYKLISKTLKTLLEKI